jgi:hypothetical protein
MDTGIPGAQLREVRERAELSQEHVAYAAGWTVSRLRRVETAAAVCAEVAQRHAGAVSLLIGLRRAVSRRIVRAARAAI